MQYEKRKRFLVNIAYWIVLLAIAYLIFKYLINLVMPFAVALVFASALRPLTRLASRKLRLSLGVASTLCVVVFFAVLGGIIVLCGARIISFLANMFTGLPHFYSNSIEPGLSTLLSWLEDLATRIDPAVVEMFKSVTPQITGAAGSFVTNLSVSAVSGVTGLMTKLPGSILHVLITIIATLFMALDYDRMAAFIMRQLPERAKQLVLDIKDSFMQVVLSYGKSYLLIMLITFSEICIGLIVIGVKNALLIAAVIALFDILPIVGAGMILLPWAGVSLIQGSTAQGIGLVLLYVIIVVIRQIIEPRIVGRRVGLHPIIALMSMVVGASLFGGLGLFGLPLTMAILVNLNATGALRIFKREEPEV